MHQFSKYIYVFYIRISRTITIQWLLQTMLMAPPGVGVRVGTRTQKKSKQITEVLIMSEDKLPRVLVLGGSLMCFFSSLSCVTTQSSQKTKKKNV